MKRNYLKKMFLLLVLITTSALAWAQTGRITGQVLDENQEGLPGVTVSLKGSDIVVATDISGSFVINQAPLGQQTLAFSFIGYEVMERAVNVTATT